MINFSSLKVASFLVALSACLFVSLAVQAEPTPSSDESKLVGTWEFFNKGDYIYTQVIKPDHTVRLVHKGGKTDPQDIEWKYYTFNQEPPVYAIKFPRMNWRKIGIPKFINEDTIEFRPGLTAKRVK